MRMPTVDSALVDRRDAIAADLSRLCAAPEAVITDADEIRAYESDGLAAYRQVPLAVGDGKAAGDRGGRRAQDRVFTSIAAIRLRRHVDISTRYRKATASCVADT